MVDCDLEAFFDHVNHDLLMTQLKAHHEDATLLRLINRYLKAGVCINGTKQASVKGVPQGGPLSPVLSNIVLKVSDKALTKLKTTVKQLSRRTRGHLIIRIIAELRKSLLGWAGFCSCKTGLPTVRGGQSVFRYCRNTESSARFGQMDSTTITVLYPEQWGSKGYRMLRRLGVSRFLAWNTAKSAHGPWRLSGSPALTRALPNRYFKNLGLPELAAR